jgi:hypothetical protein
MLGRGIAIIQWGATDCLLKTIAPPQKAEKLQPTYSLYLMGPGPCILAYGLRGFWGPSIRHIDQNLKWHPAYCWLEYANMSEAF